MQVFQLAGARSFRRQIAFAPDGGTLAVGHQQLALIDTTAAAVHTVPELPGMFWNFAFVQDGATIAGAQHSELWVFDRHTRRVRGLQIEGGYIGAFAAGADRLFVSVSDPGRNLKLRAVSLADLKDQTEFAKTSGPVYALAASADGRWLAGSSALVLHIWDVGGPALPTWPAVTKELSPNGFTFSGAGARLAAVHSHGVCLWDARTGAKLFRSGKHRRGVTAVACHPSRDVLATGDSAGKVFVWDHAGRVLTRFDWGLEQVAGLAFAPDGLRCAAVDSHGKIVVWDVDV